MTRQRDRILNEGNLLLNINPKIIYPTAQYAIVSLYRVLLPMSSFFQRPSSQWMHSQELESN